MDSTNSSGFRSELISEETMNKSYFSEGLTLDDYRHHPGHRLAGPALSHGFPAELQRLALGRQQGGAALYNVGFSALDQDGIIIRSNFQRYQGKANFTLPISRKNSR